jgi:hypothetical protein
MGVLAWARYIPAAAPATQQRPRPNECICGVVSGQIAKSYLVTNLLVLPLSTFDP